MVQPVDLYPVTECRVVLVNYGSLKGTSNFTRPKSPLGTIFVNQQTIRLLLNTTLYSS